jgi:hypothetical protein
MTLARNSITRFVLGEDRHQNTLLAERLDEYALIS